LEICGGQEEVPKANLLTEKLDAEPELLKGWELKPKYIKITSKGIKNSWKICKMFEKASKLFKETFSPHQSLGIFNLLLALKFS